MTEIKISARSRSDLKLTVEEIARTFNTTRVFIIGSQALLIAWHDAPSAFTMSAEIDAYPGNAKIWEAAWEKQNPGDDLEASEYINGRFGDGSHFHRKHGFYIDGVDERTAKLPAGWEARSLVEVFEVDGRTIEAIAPSPEDLIVSKLARLADKDKSFVLAYHAARPLDLVLMEALVDATDLDPAIAKRAKDFVRNLCGSEF